MHTTSQLSPSSVLHHPHESTMDDAARGQECHGVGNVQGVTATLHLSDLLLLQQLLQAAVGWQLKCHGPRGSSHVDAKERNNVCGEKNCCEGRGTSVSVEPRRKSHPLLCLRL